MVKYMKNYSSLLLISFLSALIITSCATTGRERSEKATTSMQSMDNDIKSLVIQLDITGASLDELMRPGQLDITKAFELYSTNVKKLESMESSFTKHADAMKARGKEYFTEWEKDGNNYKNQRIQILSEQRREQLSEVYQKISESSFGVNVALHKYISDVQEIQLYVSNDLSDKGIKSITNLSSNVVSDGENVKYNIKNIQTAIDKVLNEMSDNPRDE